MTMKEENPMNCRALSRKNTNMPTNPPLSYYVSIAMPQPNIKVKMPKLLMKSKQGRNHECNDSADVDHSRKKKKWAQTRRFLPKKVGSIMHSVFGNKKSQEMCSSNCENKVVHNDCDGFKQSITESERVVEEDDLTKNLNGKTDSKMSDQPHLLKEILEVENNEKGKQESVMADKQPLKVSLSLSCFFNKKTKGKMNRTDSFSCSKRGDSSGNRVIGKQESSSNFSRVASSRQNGCRKIRRAKSVRKKVTKKVNEESEQGDEELCKKRILMGEKCRPLNLSGTLQYVIDFTIENVA
ncbi:hypothetical protein F0562_029265 [Nyssa sinensis]|uniref:Uncharacterized protein n=1 Tax=Nyssa sinensis TaxID=561372 RepID=A0A5J5B4N9_9ASTE|nr:hypothetical protein F0562_029265 [Nyssa sinensis]